MSAVGCSVGLRALATRTVATAHRSLRARAPAPVPVVSLLRDGKQQPDGSRGMATSLALSPSAVLARRRRVAAAAAAASSLGSDGGDGDGDGAGAQEGRLELQTYFGQQFVVREWRPEDGPQVAALVRAVQQVDGFNPEGPEDDCADVHATYGLPSEGDGTMLVAVEPQEGELDKVVGCAAFVAGDEVVHLASGASASDAQRTRVAAVRRVCVDEAYLALTSPETPRGLLKFLLNVIERLAAAAAGDCTGTDFIALGYSAAGDAAGPDPAGLLSVSMLAEEGYVSSGRVGMTVGDRSYQEMSKHLEASALSASGVDNRSAELKGSTELLEVIATSGAALGVFPRAFVERHNLLHCAVGILVRNTAGDVYVHQRAPTKSVHPSMYDMFVGGLVVAGEAVETAARNEATEELGIEFSPEVADIRHIFDADFMGKRNRVVVSCYEVTVHKEDAIKYDDGEVVWGQWMPVSELVAMLEKEEFVPGGLAMWRETVKRGLVEV